MNRPSNKQEQCMEKALTSFFQQHANSNVLLMAFTLTVLTNVILYGMMPKVSVFIHIALFFLFFSMYVLLSMFILFYRMDKTVLSKELKVCVRIEEQQKEKEDAKQQIALKEKVEAMQNELRNMESMAGATPFRDEPFYRDQDIPSMIYTPTNPEAYNRDSDMGEYTASLELKPHSLLSSFAMNKDSYSSAKSSDNSTPTSLNQLNQGPDNYCFLGSGKNCSPACSGSKIPAQCSKTYYAIPGPQWQPASASSMQRQMSEGKWTASTCPLTSLH